MSALCPFAVTMITGRADGECDWRMVFRTEMPSRSGIMMSSKNQVERLLRDQLQGRAPAVRLDYLETAPFETTRENDPVVGDIIDDEKTRVIGRHDLRPRAACRSW